jgi:Peptidase family M23
MILPLSVFSKDIEPMTKSGLRWPIDATRRLTSTFGEPRPDRFHAGIDFSTRGSSGYPCFAIDDGHIFRVKLNFNGYGKVIYLRLNDGRIAIYAHLSNFDKRIDDHVKAEQLKQVSYEVELFFEEDELQYKQGDIIAYSGDTGVGPPHLHFELRDGIGKAYNPTIDGFQVNDDRKPIIRRVAIRPLDGSSEVEGDMRPVIKRVNKGAIEPVRIFGRVGISVEARDWQNGGWHRLGVKELELYVNGELRHHTVIDSFRYRHNHHARLDLDYELQRADLKRFRRLYKLDGNNLHYYDDDLDGGILNSHNLKSGDNEIRIRIVDDSDNDYEATWTIEALRSPTLPLSTEYGPHRRTRGSLDQDSTLSLDLRLVGTTCRLQLSNVPDWAQDVEVATTVLNNVHELVQRGSGIWVGRCEIPVEYRGNCYFTAVVKGDGRKSITTNKVIKIGGFKAGESDRWSVPEEGIELRVGTLDLWYDFVAGLETDPPLKNTIAPLFHITPGDNPFKKPIELAIHSKDTPWDSSAVMVYRDLKGDDRWHFLSNEREMNGFVLKAEIYSFETFSVMRDTSPPRLLKVSLRDKAAATKKRPNLSVTTYDDLSGLDLNRCKIELDGKETIWVYDPDRRTISYRPWANLSRGLHYWKVVVTDKVGNSREIERSFSVK